MKQLTTLAEYLDYGASQFEAAGLYYGHGMDNPWDEALALGLFVLNVSYDTDPKVLDEPISQDQQQQLLALFKRRIKERLPVAYLTHKAYFAGHELYVDERVLVPRSPIAELIANQFAPWVKEQRVQHILDLCTGSGCIAIACAHAFEHAKVDASDVSTDALVVCNKNIKTHQLEGRVEAIRSDLFTDIPKKQYDIIVSNPPYVCEAEYQATPAEYHHEPKLGLTAAEEGLALIIAMLQQAKLYLSSHGILIVEVGNSQQALIKRLAKVPFTWLEFEKGGEGVFLLTKSQLALL